MIAEDLLGHTLGQYRIENILGQGGMAVVYRASNAQGEVVALKVLFPPPGAGAELLARFEREARTAARLRHPAIVRVVEAGQVTGRAFMAMTLVEGQSLADRLVHTGPLDEATAADIAWQIADALDYAHRQGVVHRDVKPSNILLTPDGRALLTDFGVAQALDDSALTRTGLTVGTPAYMAPEQASGDQGVDGRADIYSLGVVLYQMVTGRTPFRGSTPQVLHAHVYDPPPAPSSVASVSPAIEAIILRALAKDAVQRFQTGAAMAQALARLEDQTSLLPASVHAEPAPSTKSRRRWLWPVALVAAIFAIFGSFVFFVFPPPNPTETVVAALPSPTRPATPLPTFTSTPAPTASPTPSPTQIQAQVQATPVPSDTPAPSPTNTPPPTLTFTPAPPAPTFTPTLTPSATMAPCPQPITTTLTVFLEGNPAVNKLGCPRVDAITTAAARQPFERGWLFWRQDVNLIYGLDLDQTWFFTGDTWRDGDPPYDPAIIPPANLYQPVRGFGKVWRERPGVREALGWATAEESGFMTVIQEFAAGQAWYSPDGQTGVILLNDGSYQVSVP